MTVTLKDAQTTLPQIVDLAAMGKEVFILTSSGEARVKLVMADVGPPRLARHPDLVGSTQVLDPTALTQPLSSEDWGWLAEP